jgi:hypothetical protein
MEYIHNVRTNERKTLEPSEAIRRAKYEPPARVWEPTTAGKWSSREWRSGEKEKYAKEVLGLRS